MQDGSTQIRVDIRVPVGVPISELVEFVKRCEDAGFYGVGIHDHHHSGRDTYMALALAASSTGRIRLYPATSNTVTRHPLVLAALANSLEEVAPGRTLLTLAPGFLSVESAGKRRAPLEKLRKDTTTVRRLCWLAKPCTPAGHPCVCVTDQSARRQCYLQPRVRVCWNWRGRSLTGP